MVILSWVVQENGGLQEPQVEMEEGGLSAGKQKAEIFSSLHPAREISQKHVNVSVESDIQVTLLKDTVSLRRQVPQRHRQI